MQSYTRILILSFATFLTLTSAESSERDTAYSAKRQALIEKHSPQDATFAALQKEMRTEETYPADYWRWKIDQYLYGQYPEFQPIYEKFAQGKSFADLYDIPPDLFTPAGETSQNMPEFPAGYFTDILPGNVNTGSTLVSDGIIYIAYQGHLTDPYVASYNIATGQWEGHYKAGHSTLSKDGRKVDSHGRPALIQDEAGYFHIVFGGHGGEQEDGLNPLSIDTPHAGGRLTHVVSEKPHDISAFTVVDDVSPFSSYGSIFKMGNGDIYFFTRSGTHKSPWTYYRMKSGSRTFDPPVLITWPTPQEKNPLYVDTFYINARKVSETEILISYLWHVCNFYEIHNKRHYHRINTYFMRMDTTDDTFYNVMDERLALPLNKSSSDELTLAYDSTVKEESCFGTRPLVLSDGRPAAAYEALGSDYREWRMTVFENGAWQSGLPLPQTQSRIVKDSGGRTLSKISSIEELDVEPGASTAAVSYQNSRRETVFALARRTTEEDADVQTWQVAETVMTLANSNLQMSVVRDSAGTATALILNIKKAGVQRLYLWHDGAFRPRS